MKKLLLLIVLLSSCLAAKKNNQHKEFMIYKIIDPSKDMIWGPTYTNFEEAPNIYYLNDIFSSPNNSFIAILPINDFPNDPQLVMSPTIREGFIEFEIKILNQENIMLKPLRHIKGSFRKNSKYLYFAGSQKQFEAIKEISDFKTINKYF
jgi:hypothetical protein